MPTNAAMIAANLDRWGKAKITRPGFAPVAQRLDAPAAKVRYLAVTAKTSVPFQVIAVTHQRECSQSWSGSLAQGDPINRPSVHVPAGRPAGTWEAVAVDALMNCAPYAGHWTDWSTGGMLTLLEKYNGVGYAAKGRPSPYIWSGTDQYVSGKYVRDGVYDPNVVDAQLGCAGLLKAMMEIDPSIQFGPAGQPQRKTPEPPKKLVKDATENERNARKGGIAGSVAGGANEATKTAGTTEKPAQAPVLPPFVAWNFVVIGIVIAIVATVLIKRKSDAIKAIW